MREDDGSVYKCTATNEYGSAEATTTVTVFCKLLCEFDLNIIISQAFHEKLIFPFCHLYIYLYTVVTVLKQVIHVPVIVYCMAELVHESMNSDRFPWWCKLFQYGLLKLIFR